jgi:hypothetical protein
MKYETPDLTVLTSAINAIQSSKTGQIPTDGAQGNKNEVGAAYEDWE